MLFSKDNNLVFFYVCFDNGDIAINEEFCSGNEREYYRGMFVFDIKYVINIIEVFYEESFVDCLRFGILCKMLCYIIYKKFVIYLIREFEELDKKLNFRF